MSPLLCVSLAGLLLASPCAAQAGKKKTAAAKSPESVKVSEITKDQGPTLEEATQFIVLSVKGYSKCEYGHYYWASLDSISKECYGSRSAMNRFDANCVIENYVFKLWNKEGIESEWYFEFNLKDIDYESIRMNDYHINKGDETIFETVTFRLKDNKKFIKSTSNNVNFSNNNFIAILFKEKGRAARVKKALLRINEIFTGKSAEEKF